MKNPTTQFLFCAGVLLFAQSVAAGDLVWLTDLDKAQVQAKAEKKAVLLVFRGSDWCPDCTQLEQQVLNSHEFIAYAQKALVLVDVDFPQMATQSDEQKRANQALKAKFNIGESVPHLVLLNTAGNTVFQEAGYSGGGLATILPLLQKHIPLPAATEAARFKNLSVEEFAKMAGDKQNVILDVRTKQEYQAGHVVGAVNLDVNAPDFEEKAKSLDKTKIYLVHCQAGVRSAKACDKLGHLDFPNLYNLPGGFKAWVAAGQLVEK